MNYRHIYHAGNFADVMKHWTLCLCLEYLKKKDKPFCVIDAHGGLGLYDLTSEQAGKTREWESGIGQARAIKDPAFGSYLSVVAKDMAKGKYPGSPLIAARLMRASDRLIANELHPDDYKTLRMVMGPKKNVQVEKRDAYEALRTHLPPMERRGLVLIDPPFEKKDEFEKLARQIKQWYKRFPTGVYLLWYPIKAHLGVAALKEAATASGFADITCFETLLHPADREESFNGSGLLIFNTPFELEEKLAVLKTPLTQALQLCDYNVTRLVATDPLPSESA